LKKADQKLPPPGWYQPRLDYVKPSQPMISFSKLDRFKEDLNNHLNSSTESDLGQKYDVETLKKMYAAQALAIARKSIDDRENNDNYAEDNSPTKQTSEMVDDYDPRSIEQIRE
jgi:hypothetical protein